MIGLPYCLTAQAKTKSKKKPISPPKRGFNHNYLKSVYETQKPHFTVIRTDKNQSEAVKTQQAEDNKTQDAILYVERFVQLGREDVVKDSPQYAIWLKHQE